MIYFDSAVKDFGEADDPHAKRRKKKLYYAKLRQQEEERQKELAAKYRDRVSLYVTLHEMIIRNKHQHNNTLVRTHNSL